MQTPRVSNVPLIKIISKGGCKRLSTLAKHGLAAAFSIVFGYLFSAWAMNPTI